MVSLIDTRVTLSGVPLQNPIIPASGTFGYGEEFAPLYDLNMLGALSTKGVTREPRFGNPTPRIAEAPAGMINSVGLENPGIDAVIREEFPRLRQHYHQPIVANICGFSIEEYAENCRRISTETDAELLEVNISCPNVRHGGMSFGATPESAAAVTAAVRSVTHKPIYMKLSPNVTDIAAIAQACEAAGADGVSLINTLLTMRIDLWTRQPILANTMGGLSGPAVFPVALRMVYQVYEAVRIPIIGLGGVCSARDVIEMMLAGATAVQVGAGNLIQPYACRDIIRDLPQTMTEYGIQALSDIIGGAHQ